VANVSRPANAVADIILAPVPRMARNVGHDPAAVKPMP
jgi:hypothetical protein